MRYNGERLNKDFKGINLSTNDLININMTNTASKINENRNRYTNIYPYDANRVLLDPYNEDDSDYINASYINVIGYLSILIIIINLLLLFFGFTTGLQIRERIYSDTGS